MFISLLSSNSSIIVSVLCLSFIAFIVFAFIWGWCGISQM
jgi:hypothetical protein